MVKELDGIIFQDNIEKFLTLLKKNDNGGCRWDDICLFMGFKKSDELCGNGIVHYCGLRENFEKKLKEYLTTEKEEILLYQRLEPVLYSKEEI